MRRRLVATDPDEDRSVAVGGEVDELAGGCNQFVIIRIGRMFAELVKLGVVVRIEEV